MRLRTTQRLGVIGAVTGLVATVLAGTVSPATAADQADYDRGYELGLDAYRYGLPLLTMQKTYDNQTSIDVSNGRGFGPVNQLNPVRSFITPEDRSVVAPNLDTLYSISWLNLKKQPQIIHVPKIKGRYFDIPLMSPYTENFANLGSVEQTPPGDYAVVGPGDRRTHLPKGVTRVKSPYDRVWIIERIYADNASAADQAKVHKLQDKITVVPLNKYGHKSWTPKTPKHPDTTIDNPSLPTGMDFYDQLGNQLAKFPPPAADQPEMEKLAEIGVGVGLHPSTDASLDPDVLAGMQAAIAAGPAAVYADAQALYAAGFAAKNGYLVTPTGAYGTDYRLRAVITQVGVGALLPEQAVYPLSLLDRTGKPLNGSKKYVIHIPAGALPPVAQQGFWSMTMYDGDGFIVANSIDRYVINDRSDLHVNADGSMDIYLQAEAPTDPQQAQNWLPAPAGGFRILWRLYNTQPSAIPGIVDGSGWQAPAIMPAA